MDYGSVWIHGPRSQHRLLRLSSGFGGDVGVRLVPGSETSAAAVAKRPTINYDDDG
jgi:hypothetical protein